MTLETLSFIFGAVLVLAGILGGGFEVKELRIPKISGMVRVFALLVGLAFIGLAFITPEPPKNGDYKSPKIRMSSMDWNTDRPGLDYQNLDLSKDDPKTCQAVCENDPQCKAWTYVKPNTIQGPQPCCWLKHTIPPPQQNTCCVSGTKLE